MSLWNVATDNRGRPVPDEPHRWDGHLTLFQLEQLAKLIAAIYITDLGARVA